MTDILDRLQTSAAYMDEKARDRFVVTAEDLHGAIAEIERLRLALEIIAGKRQCIDNLMSNVEVARAALSSGMGTEAAPLNIHEREGG